MVILMLRGGGCNNHKSTSGYLFLVGGTAVSWRSNKQTCVGLSTADEAEYMALASAAQEAVWMRQLSKDMKTGISEPTVIIEDNQFAICMTKNPHLHGRAKYWYQIRQQQHYQTEVLSNRGFDCGYIQKGTQSRKFVKLRNMGGLHSINQPVYN